MQIVQKISNMIFTTTVCFKKNGVTLIVLTGLLECFELSCREYPPIAFTAHYGAVCV